MYAIPTERFARCIAASKRVRWDVETDVIRGRRFDLSNKFLPDTLSLAGRLDCLSPEEKRYFSQVQGRTYANMFGLVERFIGAKVLELSRDHWFSDQTALEALVRFGDEELKHQALFRRVEGLIGEVMPPGYRFDWEPNQVAATVLSKGNWAVLALTLSIELFTQVHYRESMREDGDLSELIKDVFMFHWKEECQHAIVDELEWHRVDAATSPEQRDRAVDELIELINAVDAIVQVQADADAGYFAATCGRSPAISEQGVLQQALLDAYRFQYILSGVRHPHFTTTLASLTTQAHRERISNAIAGFVSVPTRRAA